MIKNALLTLGCMPVEQTNFPPDSRTVREMLSAKIGGCNAVIHVAGEVHGAEPQEREPGSPRRSYTQMEYDIARELGKPVYVFVCGDGFPYDAHEPEPAELQALQAEHRKRLQQGDHLYTPVGNRDELTLRVHALQTRVEQLGKDLSKSRSLLGRGVAIGLALVLLLGAGILILTRHVQKTETKVAALETELDKQRRWIKAVSDAYDQQQKEIGRKLTDEERFNLAVEAVAKKEGVKPTDLQSAINLFVAAVKGNPDADLIDRALADFAQKNFTQAATDAGQAADAAKKQRVAEEQMAAKLTAEAKANRDKERDARTLQGRSFDAARQFDKAAQAYDEALDITPRSDMPKQWASLTEIQGASLEDWAENSTGSDIQSRRARAIAAYHSALEVQTREAAPQDWAVVQNNLGIALQEQAGATAGPDRAKLLAQSIAAYNSALQVRTRQAAPQDWAATQNNLGSALQDQAAVSPIKERAKILAQAVDVFNAALEVSTREAAPEDWAQTKNNLGSA